VDEGDADHGVGMSDFVSFRRVITRVVIVGCSAAMGTGTALLVLGIKHKPKCYSEFESSRFNRWSRWLG